MSLPPCRLFLVTPKTAAGDGLARCLEAAAEAGDIACLLIAAGEAQEDIARMLTPLAQARDIAVVIEGDTALARKVGADGVQVGADPAAYKAARTALGADAIVGADCGLSRHAAMELAEAGADYIGFSAAAPATEREHPAVWWAALFEVPVVALDAADTAAAAELVAGRVDFIRPVDAMWDDAAAARAVVEPLTALIDARGAA